ncbi:MAG: squalene/phytoene synthase family protein [Neomegalonema sp.]|nr:squalene/phytoene synthase family protein [Neomegalonema sp.]
MAAPELSPLAARVRAEDPDRFEAALFADEAACEGLMALYAFNLELASIGAKVSEPMIGLMRLQWWRDLLDGVAAGEAPRAHEVAGPLVQAIRRFDVPLEPLQAMLTAREREFEQDGLGSLAAVRAYLDGTAGALMLAACALLAEARLSDEASALVRGVGSAQGAARLFAVLPDLAAQGRLPIRVQEGRGEIVHGKTPPELSALIAELAREALAKMHTARAQARSLPTDCAPALLAAWTAEPILRAASSGKADIFSDFGGESPFRRRARLLWLGLRGRW